MHTLIPSLLVDPRGGQGRRYPLGPCILMALLGTLAGCTSLRSLVRWCDHHREDLNTLIGTRWKRMPGESSWRWLFQRLPDIQWDAGILPGTRPGDVLHVDGKALRGSAKAGSALAYLTSLFRQSDGLVLGSLLHGTGGESTAAREALARLQDTGGLQGVWVTFDALHTQKKQ
jgi:hypothetical protein